MGEGQRANEKNEGKWVLKKGENKTNEDQRIRNN
jgi:hypothetical protein